MQLEPTAFFIISSRGKSRVIVLIHGEDTISFFGVPFR
jgi:hypothetical protein